MLAPEAESDSAVGEITAYASGRFQTEGAAAGQQDSVHLVADVKWTEGIDLLRPRGRTTNIHAAHGPLLAQDGGAAGDRLIIRDMADANAGDVGKSFHRGIYK